LATPQATTLYQPASDLWQYCMSSIACDASGNLYFFNDSGTLFKLDAGATTTTPGEKGQGGNAGSAGGNGAQGGNGGSAGGNGGSAPRVVRAPRAATAARVARAPRAAMAARVARLHGRRHWQRQRRSYRQGWRQRQRRNQHACRQLRHNCQRLLVRGRLASGQLCVRGRDKRHLRWRQGRRGYRRGARN
jgi:hypothetical protein